VISVRPFRAEDVPAIVAACQDPETQRWMPLIPVPYTEADARRYVLMTLHAWDDGTSAEFAIVQANTDTLLGSVGLVLGPNPRRHAMGYWISPEARGNGYAERAVRLVARWGFENLGFERLALWTLPGNVASQVVAERSGFRYEGLARNWEEDRNDRPVDAVMYAMTPEDLADAIAATAEPRSDARAGAAPLGATVPELADVPRQLWASGTRAAPFVELVAVADLAPGTMRRVTLADLDVLVAWTDDGILVTDDRCPHMAAPLSIGDLAGCVVACPLHEGRFDLRSGDTVQMPTTGGLDAEGEYHKPWSLSGAELKPEPPTKKLEARRLTRVNRLRYYPTRIRDGRLEAQIPILPE
jgi:RimJ/RimL family protein N-acetyltransferase/nitrite reductase/ring-hydroxylating ferredoxin subunit